MKQAKSGPYRRRFRTAIAGGDITKLIWIFFEHHGTAMASIFASSAVRLREW